MRTAILTAFFLLLHVNIAFGQSYVVEFEIILADRDLNRQEEAIVRTAVSQAAGDQRRAVERAEKLRMFRENFDLKSTASLRFLLDRNDVGYQKVSLNDSGLEIRIQIVDADESSCSIKYRSMFYGKLVSSSGRGRSQSTSQLKIQLDGIQRIISSSGGNQMDNNGPIESEHRMVLVSGRRARPEDFVPEEFDIDDLEQWQANRMNRLKPLDQPVPQFLVFNSRWERLLLVTPDRYEDFEDVAGLQAVLDERAKKSIGSIQKTCELADQQLEKIAAAFARHNATSIRQVNDLASRLLANPRLNELAFREAEQSIYELNNQLQKDYKATDSLCWQILKLQLNDQQKDALVLHCIQEFLESLSLGLQISDSQQMALSEFLQGIVEEQGGFVLDDQEYWDAIKDAEPLMLKDFFDEKELTRFIKMADFSSNVHAGLWNLQL